VAARESKIQGITTEPNIRKKILKLFDSEIQLEFHTSDKQFSRSFDPIATTFRVTFKMSPASSFGLKGWWFLHFLLLLHVCHKNAQNKSSMFIMHKTTQNFCFFSEILSIVFEIEFKTYIMTDVYYIYYIYRRSLQCFLRKLFLAFF
jgi:hypothetical protein